MKKSTLILALGPSFLACGGVPTEAELQQEIRSGVIASDYPSACLVDVYDAAYKKRSNLCSGVLIAPAVVLTAGHCLAEGAGFRVNCPFLGQDSSGKGEAAPTYRPGPSGTLDPTADDLGLILLRTRIIAKSYPKVAMRPVPLGSQVVNVGRIQDGVASSTTLYRGAGVALADGALVKFPRTYAAPDIIQPGDSGGPVYLAQTGDVVAIASGANTTGHYAVLARTDLAATWIARRVATWGGYDIPPGYQPIISISPSPLR